MSWIRRCAVAATLCAGLVVPAAASAHSSLATVRHDVNAAGSALHALKHAGARHPGAARRALARNKASMTAGARAVHSLAQSGDVRATASGLGLVAKQYDRNVRTYVSLIPTTSGSLQTQLASSLQPALDGRALSDWLLGQLTKLLPSGGDSSAAAGTLSDLLGNLPSLIQSLTGVAGGGDVSSQIQSIVAQALTTATGVLDASLAQVQALLPSLPASDQATVQAVLTQIQSILGSIQSITGSGSATGTGAGSATGTGSGSAAGPGTGSATSSGTCPGGTGSLLGNLPIPPFISGLLQNVGLGQLTGGCSASGSSSGSGIGGLSGLLDALPFGL
jgi:hypothetical protein